MASKLPVLSCELDRLHSEYRPILDKKSESDDETEGYFRCEETPTTGTPGVMIHMVPEGSKSRWSHIDDLDSFFKHVYDYHQKHGFTVMLIQEICELLQFVFIVSLTSYLFQCVHYDVLFNNNRNSSLTKTSLTDSLSHPASCLASSPPTLWLIILIAFIVWLIRAVAVLYHIIHFWDIKAFYRSALRINDEDLETVTWQEIQRRLIEAQFEHSMCIHKETLTELDVYHRILRFQNYMIAMVNKNVLPLRVKLMFLGEITYLSQGLQFNIEWLLFKSPWAPFDQWHLKEDYKKSIRKKELVKKLRDKILLLALVNLLCMPLILLYTVLRSFFFYAECIKREPGSLGVRKWSNYSRIYLRHFNEHDHELRARLNKAYKPGNEYMDSFVSPLIAVLAKNVAFISGSLLAVLLSLTVWDEDVLNVEHVLTLITLLTAVVVAMRVFIPNENIVFSPQKSLAKVLAHTHYFPLSHWKTEAHSSKTMMELGKLFPYTFTYLFHEILSPIVTPLFLIFILRPRVDSIVDFFRNFTVSVTGVGDVCSFAQMDVCKHGNPSWQFGSSSSSSLKNDKEMAEDGKTEMSLVHFKVTNPAWKPPETSQHFITTLKEAASKETNLAVLEEEEDSNDPFLSSLHLLSQLGDGNDIPTTNISTTEPSCSYFSQKQSRNSENVSSNAQLSLSTSTSRFAPSPNLRLDLRRLGLEVSSADMSLSVLYLHEIRNRHLDNPSYQEHYVSPSIL